MVSLLLIQFYKNGKAMEIEFMLPELFDAKQLKQ